MSCLIIIMYIPFCFSNQYLSVQYTTVSITYKLSVTSNIGYSLKMSEEGNGTQPQQVTQTITFAPPVITANMLPKPNPSVTQQSAEDWFKIFASVAENLVAIYRTANQEVVGQRQALATLPSLLNRNESEQRLSHRILEECTTIAEAKELVIKTVGNLENECQASEFVFNAKRGNKTPEDFYAVLVEKDRTSHLGKTCILKKFISELPENIRSNVQRKFTEARRNNPAGEIPDNEIEEL